MHQLKMKLRLAVIVITLMLSFIASIKVTSKATFLHGGYSKRDEEDPFISDAQLRQFEEDRINKIRSKLKDNNERINNEDAKIELGTNIFFFLLNLDLFKGF